MKSRPTYKLNRKPGAGETSAAPDYDPERYRRSAQLIGAVCGLAGSLTFLDDIRADVQRAGILDAVAKRDTSRVSDWLLSAFSYQGISDQVARGYIRKHGNVTWSDIEGGLDAAPSCPLLQSYWHFDGCRYDKGSFSCSEPDHIDTCPVPRHRLRNGRLNQTAYSFFLFVRDVAKGDLIGWIDDRLKTPASALVSPHVDLARERQERLIGPLRNIYGVSDKIPNNDLLRATDRCLRPLPALVRDRQRHDRRRYPGP